MALMHKISHNCAMEQKFWEKLRDHIAADPDLSVAGVAITAGLANSTIRQMIANQRNPRLETAERICVAMGTTYEDFMADRPKQPIDDVIGKIRGLSEGRQDALYRFLDHLVSDQASSDPGRTKE